MGYLRVIGIMVTGIVLLAGCFKTEDDYKAERIAQAKPDVFYRMLADRGYTNLNWGILQAESGKSGEVVPNQPLTLSKSMFGGTRVRIYSAEEMTLINSSMIGNQFYYSRNQMVSSFSTIRFYDEAMRAFVTIRSNLTERSVLFETAYFQ